MKLGLLVVLAVAVLVPSLSESRTVSECELKEKLGEKLVLSKKLQGFKDTILKVVICNLKWRTRLNTERVRVIGHRKKTTTTKPVTTKPVTTKPTITETTTKPTTTETTTKPTTTETTTNPTTTETTTMAMTTNSTTAEAMTTRSNQSRAANRKKREADTTSEEHDSMDTDDRLEGMLNEEEGRFDEEELWQDDNRMEDEDNKNDEGDQEVQELEEGGKRKKRSLGRGKGRRKWRIWSLGYYGIFELSDSHFCDSGYRWSKNVCDTRCSAFTDDDITDDIDCLVKTHYWQLLFWNAPRWCRHVSVQRFFHKCE